MGRDAVILQWAVPSTLFGRVTYVAFYRRSLQSVVGGRQSLIAAVNSVYPIVLAPGQTLDGVAQEVADISQAWIRHSEVATDQATMLIPLTVR